MADIDTPLKQEIFDLPQRQRIANVHHHCEADHLRRTVEITERISHPRTLRDAPSVLKKLCSDSAKRTATTRPRQISDRIQNLAKIHLPPSPGSCRARQKRFYLRPFFVRQIGWIALRLPLDLGHTASRRSGPHPNLESRQSLKAKRFQTVS
jgi:hypothetical protein